MALFIAKQAQNLTRCVLPLLSAQRGTRGRLSVNRNLDELRNGFEELRERLTRLCKVDTGAWNQSFKDESSLATVKLLRALESAASEAEVLSDAGTKLFATRLGQEVDTFRVAIEGQVLMRTPSTDRVGQTVSKAFGLPTGGWVTNYILKAVDEERFCDALGMLNRTRGTFLSALEDIRMLYEMRLLPMEERDRIRQALVEAEMPEVASRLAKADEQRVDDAPACIGHCREALALTVHDLAKAKVSRSTDSFAGDLAELGKTKGFIPPDERRLVVAFYSYLSSKWKAGEEPRTGDAELALKLTYFIVDRLLGTLNPAPTGKRGTA